MTGKGPSIAFFLALVWTFAFPIKAAQPLTIPRVTHAPKLDDFLHHTPREAETTINHFLQREPHDGAPATQSTTAYLSYDAHHLYVAFHCIANPTRLRARMSRRDNLNGDERVSIELDTFHDRRRAYVFFSNPAGVQMDGIITEGQEDDYSFDTIWKSEARIVADGYIVLFSIPFKSLRFPNDSAATWGIALTRYTPDTKEWSTFPFLSRKHESYIAQFADLEGIHQVQQSKNIQLTPYGFFGAQRFLDDASFEQPIGTPAQFIRKTETRAGLDAKVVLKNSFTLDVTMNPDFSQVEADEPQVTVNQRFEVFFPERRPFFLENAGFFETPETLFFSRRIIAPEFGARLTGKFGRWAMGILGTDDRGPGNTRATIAVARLQREFSRDSMIGGIITSRELYGRSNRVYAVDTRLRLNSNWVATGQAIRSELTTTNQAPLTGQSNFAELRHSGKHLTYYSWYRDRSPGFRSDLGFIPRVDIRNQRNSASYRWRPESGKLLSFGPSILSYANWDSRGQMQDWFVETPFRLEFRGPTVLTFSRSEGYEYYRSTGLRRHGNELYVSTDRLRWFGIAASWNQGKAINFFPAAGLRPFTAASSDAFAGITLRPTRNTRVDETYYYTRLGNVFTNHVWRSKINHQFSRSLSLRLIVDYRGTLPNESLVHLDKDKRLVSDVLLTYLLHPGTALHAGYTNRRENLNADLFRFGGPTMETGRQFFVKLSYALRL